MTSSEHVTHEHKNARTREVPPDDFVRQVKQALERLYDLSYLQGHPLAQEDGVSAQGSAEIGGQRLRRELASAIEALSPGAGVPFRAPHARLYNLMRLHYVQRMTVQEAAHELGVSLRQAYRDLRRGEESVAAVLWARRSKSPLQEPRATQLSSAQAEMAQLETHPRSADLRLLLQHAQEAVGPLARQHNVSLYVEPSQEPVVIFVDLVVARQVLINVLSHAVQQAQRGILHVDVETQEEWVSLTLRYDLGPEPTGGPTINLVVAQLADRLGWTLLQEDQPWGTRTVELQVPVHSPTVLVVDDNEGLVKLVDRYLTDQACHVIAAPNGQEGLRLAQQSLPDAIVLDVMMPEMDGWELLQRLNTHPQTADIPVIICSVINDPDLAYSLGASLFLPKPVSRAGVLEALRQLGVM